MGKMISLSLKGWFNYNGQGSAAKKRCLAGMTGRSDKDGKGNDR
jgi:hypothetical protein